LDERTAGIVAKMVLVAKQMAEVHKTEAGYRLMINSGRAAGQVVFHLHMHLMGGWGQKPGRP
jgi:histidine triad (HIT) family protein